MTPRRFYMFAKISLFGLLLCATFPRESAAQCGYRTWTPLPIFKTAGAKPAAVVFNDNLHVFVTGNGSRIFSAVFHRDTGWTRQGYVSLSQNVTTGGNGSGAVVYNNSLYLFVVDAAGRVLVNVLPGNVPPSPLNSSGWKEIPGGLKGTQEPSAAAVGNSLYLNVRGADGSIVENVLVGTSWSGWHVVPGGGLTTHGPSATHYYEDDKLYLYVRGTDAHLYENARDAIAWRGWRRIRNDVITASPAATGEFVQGFTGPIEMATRITGGGIAYQIQDPLTPGNSLPPADLLGQIYSTAAPAVLFYARSTSAIFLAFVPGPGDVLYCSSI